MPTPNAVRAPATGDPSRSHALPAVGDAVPIGSVPPENPYKPNANSRASSFANTPPRQHAMGQGAA